MCDMTNLYLQHDVFISDIKLRERLARTLPHSLDSACRDTFIRVTWRIHIWHRAARQTRSHTAAFNGFCLSWHIHTCDMTHSYVWHDKFKCVTWRIHMCDMMYSCMTASCTTDLLAHYRIQRILPVVTHSYVWHDTFICVPWQIYMCNMTYSYV